jgi:type IV secretory pathway VirB6-like protein
LVRALGFGQEVSVPNLIMMILGGFLTGGLGVIFFVGTFLFAFFLFSIVLRCIHIFLMSMILIVLMIYVSPITIVAAMFKRTNGIFEKWWKELLAQVLQPMILFVYLGIVITMFDRVIIGADVTFSSSTVVIRGERVLDTYGRISPKGINCDAEGAESSIYCIFKVADIKTWGGFAPIGVGLPMLDSLNQAKLDTILKSALIMFILLHFIDHVSEMAKTLVGGGIGMAGGFSSGLAGKALSVGKAFQSRGKGAMKKGVGMIARKGIGGAKSVMQALGNKGKSIAKNLPAPGPNADRGGSQVDSGGNADRGASQSAGSKNSNADNAASAPRSEKGPQGADRAASSGDVEKKKPGPSDRADSSRT